MPHEIPKTHFYYGTKKSGKTSSVREAVKALLQSTPGMTYTVLGDDEFSEYRFDEGYEPKPSKIRVNKTSLEVVTEADIIIVPETMELHDLFIAMAASQTGKHVFSEAVTPSRESAIAMLNRFNKRNALLLEKERDMAENVMRARNPFTFTANYEETTDDIPLLETFVPKEGKVVFHHCEIPASAKKKPTEIIHKGLKNINFKTGGIKVIFGETSDNFETIFEDLLDNLIENGTYASYAVFTERLTKDRSFANHTGKRKPIVTHFAPRGEGEEDDERKFITAETDADVIVIPWSDDYRMMSFLRFAVATGKPIFIGVDASNTHNARALIDEWDEQMDTMGWWMFDDASDRAFIVETDAQPTKEEKYMSDNMVSFGRCTSDGNGVSTVSWYNMDGLALLNS